MIDKNPPQPADGPLTVSAIVRAANNPVTAVTLFYRRMFAAEIALPMADDERAGMPRRRRRLLGHHPCGGVWPRGNDALALRGDR